MKSPRGVLDCGEGLKAGVLGALGLEIGDTLSKRTPFEIYRISASFPQDERFGVTSQPRRAILARDLEYLSPAAFERLASELDEAARMLHGLRVKVEAGT